MKGSGQREVYLSGERWFCIDCTENACLWAAWRDAFRHPWRVISRSLALSLCLCFSLVVLAGTQERVDEAKRLIYALIEQCEAQRNGSDRVQKMAEKVLAQCACPYSVLFSWGTFSEEVLALKLA